MSAVSVTAAATTTEVGGMTSSTGARCRDVAEGHLESDHDELHSTSILCDATRRGATDDAPMTNVSGQSLPRRDAINDGRITGRTDPGANNRYLQDVTEPREPLDGDVTWSQYNDESSRQRSASFSSNETLASSSTLVYRSHMHLRSKTSRSVFIYYIYRTRSTSKV